MNSIDLIPSYWASVSGGKDSLYMLRLILDHLDLYPLDGVVHFELDIDYPFIKDVIDYMEAECNKHSIPFYRVTPVDTWENMFYRLNDKGNIYGFPTRKARWCNSQYKLSCKSKWDKYMKSLGRSTVYYIGYCVDEVQRYSKRKKSEIYPLVDFGIYERDILSWARGVELFNNYYLTNDRCGCMYCPLSSYLSYAYLFKYYPENYKYMIDKMKETERIRSVELGRPFSCIQSNPKYNVDYLDNVVRTRYIYELEYRENNVQLSLF